MADRLRREVEGRGDLCNQCDEWTNMIAIPLPLLTTISSDCHWHRLAVVLHLSDVRNVDAFHHLEFIVL